MLHVIWSILIGFLVGLIARAVMPGMQHMGFWMTALVGVAGSIVGGVLARLFSKPNANQPYHPAGLLLSVVGALLVLFLVGKLQ